MIDQNDQSKSRERSQYRSRSKVKVKVKSRSTTVRSWLLMDSWESGRAIAPMANSFAIHNPLVVYKKRLYRFPQGLLRDTVHMERHIFDTYSIVNQTLG